MKQELQILDTPQTILCNVYLQDLILVSHSIFLIPKPPVNEVFATYRTYMNLLPKATSSTRLIVRYYKFVNNC